MKNINQYIDQEILHKLYKGLHKCQYSLVASAIRIKALKCLRELLPLQEPPDFYQRVLKSVDELAAYFEIVCRKESYQLGSPCEEVTTFRRTLQTYALTTEQLQLAYFREVSNMHSPVKYSLLFHYKIENKNLFEFIFSMNVQSIMVILFFVLPMKLLMILLRLMLLVR